MVESATATVLSDAQRNELRTLARAGASTQKLARRCRIMLLVAEGLPNRTIARQVGVSRPTVLAVRTAFARGGVEALRHDQRRARKRRKLTAELEQKLIDATLQSKPLGATHWSTRTMARAQGLSEASVRRIWKHHNLKPHLTKTFKLSRDPQFVEKLHDVVGLYMNPPEKALVLCVDEKCQIQALDRTQPGLPMKPGRCGTFTHDYKRHGTTTLFAALNVLDGKVIGDCMPLHRHQEFIRFLKRIDQETPSALNLHIIVDNYSAHKHPRVRSWLKRHPRFQLHFTPTSSSWLNLVERWFAYLTQKRIRRGTFHNIPALIKAIQDYIENNNQNPHVFVWTASVERIMNKIAKCKEASDALH